MTANRSYRVEPARSGNWWAITVPELDGVLSQARRLDQVEARAREAIALMLDIEEREVGELEVSVEAPDSVAALLPQMQDSEATANAAGRRAASLRRQVAQRLRDDGYPVRDIGRLTGISYERVGQILASTRDHRSQ